MTKFLAFLGVLTMAGVLIFLIIPPGPPMLFDGNLTRLAQSSSEGYCAGYGYFQSATAAASKKITEECREKSTLETDVDLTKVIMSWCIGAQAAGYDGSVSGHCVPILIGLQYWPTYDGWLTQAWTDLHPYPLNMLESGEEITEDYSRTGGRPGIENRGE